MSRSAWGAAVLALWLAGCHCCDRECEVTQICCPEVTTEKVVKDGWDVECHEICIPPIHCPWTDPCRPRCGKVIVVKRLKEDSLECGERCLLEYKLTDPCPMPEFEAPAGDKQQPKAVPAPEPVSGS